MSRYFSGIATVAVVRYRCIDVKTRWQFLRLCNLIDRLYVLILTFIVVAIRWEMFGFLLSIFGASVFKPNLKINTFVLA